MSDVPYGVIGAITGLIVALGGLWKGLVADKVSEKSGVITSNQAGTAQVIGGYEGLLAAAEAAAARMEASLRADVEKCDTKIASQDARIEKLVTVVDELKLTTINQAVEISNQAVKIGSQDVEISRLRLKYGNGDPGPTGSV